MGGGGGLGGENCGCFRSTEKSKIGKVPKTPRPIRKKMKLAMCSHEAVLMHFAFQKATVGANPTDTLPTRLGTSGLLRQPYRFANPHACRLLVGGYVLFQ